MGKASYDSSALADAAFLLWHAPLFPTTRNRLFRIG